MPSSHLILCRPLLLLPPIPPSFRVFSNESTLRMRWPKYWSFSFSIIPSKEIQGLISFRIDWLDLLAVQGTLKRILQHHSSKASIILAPNLRLLASRTVRNKSLLFINHSVCGVSVTLDWMNWALFILLFPKRILKISSLFTLSHIFLFSPNLF